MMARFYGYLDKVFQFRDLTARLTDSRREPLIPTAAVFGTAFAMFATCRGSLNGIDKERQAGSGDTRIRVESRGGAVG